MSYERVTQLQSRIIIGSKQTIKAMRNDEICEVFVAQDADPHITEGIVNLARELDIPYVVVDSKQKLGVACKIDVDASTVAIRRE